MDSKYILDQYEIQKRSIPDIAEEFETYNNKIRRILLKAGAKMRDKSESQKIALEGGRAIHPTEGKERNEETKLKLSESTHNAWKSLSKKELKDRKKNMGEAWKKRDPQDIADMQKKAAAGVSKAGREGSKIEHFLVEELSNASYNILAHKKGLIPNCNLEPDLIIPDLKIIIEIDGPTHFFPIWSEESFKKTIASDAEKNALFLQAGFCVLRVKHICKTLTDYKKRTILKTLIEEIEKIKKNHSVTIIEIEL